MLNKIVFLPSEYLKEMVDIINSYFDSGYEVYDILDADGGYYIVLSKDYKNYDYRYKLYDENYNLIEENNNKWVKTTTNDVLLN